MITEISSPLPGEWTGPARRTGPAEFPGGEKRLGSALGRTRQLLITVLAALGSFGCLEGDPNPYADGDESDSDDSATSASSGGGSNRGELPLSAGVARGDGRSAIDPGTQCSGASASAVTVRFENGYPAENLELYWVDRSCSEVLYTTIVPGASYSQATYTGHIWRLRSERGLLHEYTATDEINQLVPLP